MGKKRDIKGGTKEQLIGSLIGYFAYFLSKTLRFKIFADPELVLDDTSIYCFWHNRAMMAPVAWQRLTATAKLCCLTSASKDGTLTAAMMECYGIPSVRGSSSRRGKQAMIEMIRTLRSGSSLAITPDGPRGPKYQLDPGLIKLASKTQTPIVAATINYSSCWELRTWDKFRIPKPFSTVEIIMPKPLLLPKNLSEEEVLATKSELEAMMGT